MYGSDPYFVEEYLALKVSAAGRLAYTVQLRLSSLS